METKIRKFDIEIGEGVFFYLKYSRLNTNCKRTKILLYVGKILNNVIITNVMFKTLIDVVEVDSD